MSLLENQEEARGSSLQFFFSFPNVINNEVFLLLMDEINIKISNLIKQKKHNLILNIFVYYLENELYLKKLLNRFKNKKIHNYNLRKYREILELQNYYNNFRILLISQIAEYMTQTFNKLQRMIDFDLLKSLKYFTYYEKVLNFYIENFKYKMHSEYNKISNINSEKMIQYNQTLKIFIELKEFLNTIPKSKKAMFALLAI